MGNYAHAWILVAFFVTTDMPVIVLSCICSEWHHHSNHPRSLPPEVQKTHPRIGKPHNGVVWRSHDPLPDIERGEGSDQVSTLYLDLYSRDVTTIPHADVA